MENSGLKRKKNLIEIVRRFDQPRSVDVPKVQPVQPVKIPSRQPDAAKKGREELMKEKMHEMIDAMPKVEERLEAAGLTLGQFENEVELTDADLAEYQTKAMNFRESLVTEEPRLAPLKEIVDGLTLIFEAEVAKIDLSDVNSVEDLFRELRGLGHAIEVELKKREGNFSESRMETLMQGVNMEVFMAFFMSVIREYSYILMKFFSKNKENLTRLGQLFRQELLVPTRSSVTTVRTAPEMATGSNERWTRLMEHGPYQSGRIELPGRYNVVVDLDQKIIGVGAKKATITLPEGMNFHSIQFLPHDSLVLTVTANDGRLKQTVLTGSQVHSYITAIMRYEDGVVAIGPTIAYPSDFRDVSNP